jgi:PAS domain S-box-containing protein
MTLIQLYIYLTNYQLKSLKIPLSFLIIGILWALFSDPLITFFFIKIDIHKRDIIRSINDFAFVGFASVILYFQIKIQQDALIASENQYRNLFERNPNPMWIYNTDNLKFVKVNHAATDLYGYSMDEFLTMTIKDIRPANEHDTLIKTIESLNPGVSRSDRSLHSKKSGESLYLSIVTYDLTFNNEFCRLVIATNITDMILKEEKIKAQNTALQDIAWSNSHEVRRSLCSVISLIDLLKNADNDEDRDQCIKLLEICSTEFDHVLLQTNKKADMLKSN